MSTILLTILIVGILGALCIAMAEASGGFIGDYSMVPGCLGITLILLFIVFLLGMLVGDWGIWIK